jgi:hypothetical protein
MRVANKLGILLLTVLTGCNLPPDTEQSYVEDRSCAAGRLLLDAHFEGGKLGRCTVLHDGVFQLTNYPEDPPPINVSPWYAFRLSGKPGDEVTIRVGFEHGFARYWPKISLDGETWERLDEQRVVRSKDGAHIELNLELAGSQTWIAGQELLTSRFYDGWIQEMDSMPHVRVRLAGKSVRGRPIYLAETPDRGEIVLLLGRQHPPEVTGALAMRAFVSAVLAETALARSFRERFKLLILPLMNPDGVAAGHWRHNVNGVDLNRDWGPFSQPETRIVRDWLAAEGAGTRLRLMLDFHSTAENVFDTQKDEDPSDPPDFTRNWMEAAARSLPDYEFRRDAQETSEQANSKNYFYTRYGIPAITYETGDETPREAIRAATVVFAEEMMRLMLSYPPPASDGLSASVGEQ